MLYRAEIFNLLRPLLLSGGGIDCLKQLDTLGASYSKLGNLSEGKCFVKNAVKVSKYSSTELSSPVVLSCPSAVKLANLLAETKASRLEHMGSYHCRKVRGSNLISEHGYGTAIDISRIDLASVKKDWKKKNNKGQLLNDAYLSACSIFSNVLGPYTDKAHHDHFHLDSGLGFGCLLHGF